MTAGSLDTTTSDTFNAVEYLVDRNLAERREHPAVISTSRTLRYGELSTEVRRVATGLRELGVRPEERVLMCMSDDVELFTAILGTMYLGAVAVPCSTMLTGAELGTLVRDSRARVVIATNEFADNARTAVEDAVDVRHLVVAGGRPGAVPVGVAGHRWDQVLHGEADPVGEPYPTWPDSPALWLYTSGTTGKPKAAMHRHDDIRVVSENYGRRVLGICADDRCLSVAKLFFAYGIGNSMFFPLAAGGTTLLESGRPSPELFAGRAQQDQPTLLFGTPSFWGPLLASDIPDGTFASVRQGISAGEALPPRMFHGMSERFGVEVLDGIGSTELLHIFISNRPGQVHPGSSGTAVPGYDVEIRAEDGAIISETGTPGELYVRGPSAATGYWCRAEASRRVFVGEWMRTGDTYVRNEDGTFSCLGRLGDMLKAGGIWVTPSEVEDRLLEHDDVAEAVVIAVPDTDGLDTTVACVVPMPGKQVDSVALVQWCRLGLAAFKRPRAVFELAEIPKTATGKVRRNVLRAEFGGHLLVGDVPEADASSPSPPATARDTELVASYEPRD